MGNPFWTSVPRATWMTMMWKSSRLEKCWISDEWAQGSRSNFRRDWIRTNWWVDIFVLHVCCFLVMMHKGFLKFSRWERQVDLVRHTHSQVKKKNPYRKPNESSSLCVLVRAGKLHKQFSWKFSYRIRLLSSPKSPDLFVYTWFHLTKTQVSMRSGSQTCRRGSFCSRGL